MHMAFAKDASQLVVLVAPDGSRHRRCADHDPRRRHAGAVGRSIEPRAFVGAYVGVWYASPQFAVSPDGHSLITASEDGELARWDLRTRTKTRTWKIETGLAPALAVSPDGLTAAVGIEHGVQLVDLRSGTVRTATADLRGARTGCSSARTATMVVSTNRDTTVTRWDVESADPFETLRGHSNFVQQPVFSPDGETLYTVSHDGTAIAWDLTGDRRLGRTVHLHERSDVLRHRVDGHPGEYSPDGRLIAVGLKERGIALWDARELTRVGRPFSQRAARSSRSPSHRMGER